MYSIFRFVLFYRITCDSFCSIKLEITTFDRLDFTFVQRCVVVKDVSVKERHSLDNLIQDTQAVARQRIRTLTKILYEYILCDV